MSFFEICCVIGSGFASLVVTAVLLFFGRLGRPSMSNLLLTYVLETSMTSVFMSIFRMALELETELLVKPRQRTWARLREQYP